MLSNLLRHGPNVIRVASLLKREPVKTNVVRRAAGFVPPTQYDVPIPRRLHLGYTLSVYIEIIPLFATTCLSFSILTVAIIWAIRNKVDVVYHTRDRSNISRTMNLRIPTVHKMVTINQRTEPWPEMQDVLDKMIAAEHRELVRMKACNHP